LRIEIGGRTVIHANSGGIALSSNERIPPNDIYRSENKERTPFIAMTTVAPATSMHPDIKITVGHITDESVQFLKDCRNRLLTQISFAALLFALSGYWLMRRGLSPLRGLAEKTETITIANLTARIDAAGAPRELSPVIDSFNAMLGRLHTGFSQLSQVSADMAHDLRTPINNLLGQTEVALGQTRNAEQYETLLASNLEELQRLSKMIDNMLFLARSENATTEIERRKLNVATELQCVAEYFEGLAEERGLDILIDADESVFADSMLMRRALANLVANAIQYADQGTTIRLQAAHSIHGTRLMVENHGPTIDEAHLMRIFDRFYRADASRRGSSTASGLGLSIVRSIMTLHHGTCNATSVQGITRFTLFFPSTQIQTDATTISDHPATHRGNARHHRITRRLSSLFRYRPVTPPAQTVE
jgi:two-component system heavy metal sensor histidine kinase CusS